MIALCVILILLLLFLILPVGVDASYLGGDLTLKARAGPLRIQILPKKEKKPGPEKPEKEKKKKPKAGEAHEKKKMKLGPDDILTLVKIVLKALSRFRKSLSVDRFMLHAVSAAGDPCDAVMLYGYLNAGLSSLSPLFHRALKIRDEDIWTDVDLSADRMLLEARIVATLQIWEILFIVFAAGFAFLRWFLRRRKRMKAHEIEQKG